LVNSSIVLVCAVFGSLAAGVFLAYWVCMGMFQVFRIHARQVAGSRLAQASLNPQVAQGNVVEG
jgi:hypothetical protein